MFSGSDALVLKIHRSLQTLASMPVRLGVAVSGGPDSAMLAVAASEYAKRHALDLHLLHVHHGLQQAADEWQHRVHDLAHQLMVPCHSRRVKVDTAGGKGLEAAARDARYAALCAMATQVGAGCVLLGHHQHDQAETVLLRLLRGAGPEGLAAMPAVTRRDAVLFIRPWLDVDRAAIMAAAQDYAARTGWHYVTDPTNTQDRYTRGALRERLAPALDARWPGWHDRLARHARQAAQTRAVLDEVAAADLVALDYRDDDHGFDLKAWRALSPARQALVLRYWLGIQNLPMPTQARLDDLMRQLRQLHALGFDRALRVRHAEVEIACVRGRVVIHTSESSGTP